MASKNNKLRRREKLLSTVWGGMWGVVVGGVIVTVASQLAIRHDLVLPQPEARAVDTPTGSEFDQARPETDPDLPGDETVPGADIAAVTPSSPGPADSSPSFDTQSAAAPNSVVEGPNAPGRPNVPAEAGVALTDRTALRPETGAAPEAAAPLPPSGERPLVVARDVPEPPKQNTAEAREAAEVTPVLPAAEVETPPAPEETSVEPARDVAEVEPATDELPPTAAQIDAAPTLGSVELEAPVAPNTDALEAPRQVSDAAPQRTVPSEAPDLDVLEPAPDVRASLAEPSGLEGSEAVDPPVEQAALAPVDPMPVPDAPSRPEAAGDLPEKPVPAATEPQIIQLTEPPALETEPATTPVVRELPASEAAEESGDADVTVEAEVTGTTGALEANRQAFDRDPSLSQMAVVLLHEGSASVDETVLETLPAEVGFAVDAGLSGATDIAAAYKAAGREVVLIPSLPPRATPQDVEVSLGANLAGIEGAVAVMDPGSAGFQSDRAAVGQVVSILATTGHGLITATQGLNTAQQIADRFGVPSALIFNDLGKLSDADAASRALDRIAFRARTEDGIIIFGRGDDATAEGLSAWIASRAAQGLQLAPVSSVLAPKDGVDVETSGEGEASTVEPRRFPQIGTDPATSN